MIRSIILAAAGLVNRLFGYNLSTATLASSFTFPGQGTSIENVVVTENGLKCYIANASTNSLTEYNLTTPYSVQSRVQVAQISIGFTGGVYFKPDGTKFWWVNGITSDPRVYSYTMSTPWSLATATVDFGGGYLDLGTASSQGIWFDNSGTLMFIANLTSTRVDTYGLATPFDISSFTGLIRTYSTGSTTCRALAFNNDGTRMYTGNGLFPAHVREHLLTTPFDTSTASVNYQLATGFDYVSGINFAKFGFKMYIVDYSSDRFREYNLTA